jgi:hypothetical protein
MLNTTPNLIDTTTPAKSLFEIQSSTGILWLDIQAHLLAHQDEIARLDDEFDAYKAGVTQASSSILNLLDEDEKSVAIRAIIASTTNAVNLSSLQKACNEAANQLAAAQAKLNEATRAEFDALFPTPPVVTPV